MEIWDSKTPLWIFFPMKIVSHRLGMHTQTYFLLNSPSSQEKLRKQVSKILLWFLENTRHHNLTLQKSYCAIFMSFIFVLFRRLCISKRQEEKYGSSN